MVEYTLSVEIISGDEWFPCLQNSYPQNVLSTLYYLIELSEMFFKGKRSFGKFFFFLSSPRQENMERKSKLKKNKLKFLYFRPHKRLFGSAERELNGGEWSVS